jgi:hypothetical protein
MHFPLGAMMMNRADRGENRGGARNQDDRAHHPAVACREKASESADISQGECATVVCKGRSKTPDAVICVESIGSGKDCVWVTLRWERKRRSGLFIVSSGNLRCGGEGELVVEPEDSWTGCECVTWVCRVCVRAYMRSVRQNICDRHVLNPARSLVGFFTGCPDSGLLLFQR